MISIFETAPRISVIRLQLIIMNCNCIRGSSNSYERLCDSESLLELADIDDVANIKQVKIDFYNDDGSFKSVVVEENLRTSDLCQLLALKNHVSKDVNWAVIEYVDDLGLERSLEDHEEVLKVFLRWKRWKQLNGNKFFFRKDFRKYEMLTNPMQFFPLDMIDCDAQDECLTESTEIARTVALQCLLNHKDEAPKIFGHLWIQKSLNELWKKAFFLLVKKTLYYSFTSTIKDPSKLSYCANLQDYDIYSFVKTDSYFKVPTEFCFCLKPHEQLLQDVDAKDIFFACDNERIRKCWIAGFRIAKFGKQLWTNFQSFKFRVNESLVSSEKDYANVKVMNVTNFPKDSARTRVAMDFTGTEGKIIADPKEIEAIVYGAEYKSKKFYRPPSKRNAESSLGKLGLSIHIVQPWFHSGLTRDEATQLLQRHGTVDGIFLVRESQSLPNAFVLSFVFAEKIYHSQILPMDDNEQTVFSIDNGKTKFYDILQLVEFHQLNCGCLPTRLTHSVVQVRDIFKMHQCKSMP